MKLTLILSTLLLLAVSSFCIPVPDQSSEESADIKIVLSKAKFFDDKYIIYRGEHTVTNIQVSIDDIDDDDAEALVFFNQVDIKPNGEKVELGQFLLVNGTAQKIFDGRDSTSDLGSLAVYFGAKDGLYVYNHVNKNADKFGNLTDSIVQLQITNGTHEFYILTEPDYRIYKVNEEGTSKSLVEAIPSAKEFVLDRQNNVYYFSEDNVPYVLVAGSSQPVKFTSFTDVKNPKLVRPALLFSEGVPFVVDGDVYVLNPNGTSEDTNIQMLDQPTAISIEVGLVQYYALDGNIYEYNFVEIFLKTLLSEFAEWLTALKDKVVSLVNASSNEI